MMTKWFQNFSCKMKQTTFWIGLYCFYAMFKCAQSIDCYDCKSVDGNNKRCEDAFETDYSTYDLISRDCFYSFWKAHFCIKLKAVRADGSSLLVRQCAVKDWGSRCGLIHFESPHGVEEVDGCLESCDYDGCNTATSIIYRYSYITCFISVVFVQMTLLLLER